MAHTAPETDIDQLVDLKFRAAYAVVRNKHGVVNQTAMAGVLYDALFQPDAMDAIYGSAMPAPTEQAYASLVTQPSAALTPIDRTEFIDAVRSEVTARIDHAACLYPGAKAAASVVLHKYPTAIWTEGDVHGLGEDLPGSYEQVRKITGVTNLSQEDLVAWAAGKDAVPLVDGHRFTVVASEGKFRTDQIDRLLYFFAGRVEKLVILEDRLANLEKLCQILAKHGYQTTGLWVRQGIYGTADGVPTMDGVRAVGSITEAAEVIAALGEGYGVISDFDGVFSDGAERTVLQVRAVQDLLRRKGWA